MFKKICLVFFSAVFFFSWLATVKAAEILDLPYPKNFNCFWDSQDSKTLKVKKGCEKFYKKWCVQPSENVHISDANGFQHSCVKFQICMNTYHPVYDEKGLFYPNTCWAETLGAKKYTDGISPRVTAFFQDLWAIWKIFPWERSSSHPATNGSRPPPPHGGGVPVSAMPSSFESAFIVPSPDIWFTYLGSFFSGFKNGTFFRSTLWRSATNFLTLDFDIHTSFNPLPTPDFYEELLAPVYGERKKVLIAFLNYDDALIPEKLLLDTGKDFAAAMNEYWALRQKVSNPVQYDFKIVVLPPIPGISIQPSIITPVTLPSGMQTETESSALLNGSLYVSAETEKIIYKAALKKAKKRKFDVFVISPIYHHMRGGHTTGSSVANQLVYIPLGPKNSFVTGDQEEKLLAFYGVRDFWETLSHEIDHHLGLSGDHVPMEIRDREPLINAMKVDEEGRMKGFHTMAPVPMGGLCDETELNPDQNNFALPLPPELQFTVGEEPDWMNVIPSASGPCLFSQQGGHSDEFLKDMDGDGTYDLPFHNQDVSTALQRTLGWGDVDGDHIAELVDSDPYGGYQVRSGMEKLPKTFLPASKFSLLEEVTIGSCRFQKIIVGNEEGLFPLSCPEFDPLMTNIYKTLTYRFYTIKKSYGTVMIPAIDLQKMASPSEIVE